jgi:hypothetical protein
MRPRYLHCPPSLPGPSNYYACLASASIRLSPPTFLPESAGEGVLISTYGIPYVQSMIHTGVTTRLDDTCVSANNNAVMTAIE